MEDNGVVYKTLKPVFHRKVLIIKYRKAGLFSYFLEFPHFYILKCSHCRLPACDEYYLSNIRKQNQLIKLNAVKRSMHFGNILWAIYM